MAETKFHLFRRDYEQAAKRAGNAGEKFVPKGTLAAKSVVTYTPEGGQQSDTSRLFQKGVTIVSNDRPTDTRPNQVRGEAAGDNHPADSE